MLSRVVGRHCESGDIVVRHAYLPSDLAPGDLLAVPATGAYCRSLASNYNHVSRPAVVAVGAGAARTIGRPEPPPVPRGPDPGLNRRPPPTTAPCSRRVPAGPRRPARAPRTP